MDVPVILVANKTDQFEDRMISTEEGYKRSQEIGCACFHEISIRESIEEVNGVFRDICRFWRFISRWPKLKRSKSDSIRLSMTLHSDIDPERIMSICCDRSILTFGRNRYWQERNEHDDEFDELDSSLNENEPFRSRAKTDGNLLISRSRKFRIPSPIVSPPVIQSTLQTYKSNSRRNSIAMRGHVSC
jgi:hypothetical protein